MPAASCAARAPSTTACSPTSSSFPPEGWTEQSACKDWQATRSSRTSAPSREIIGGMIKAAVLGEPPMTDEQRRAIWGYFDNLKPLEVLPAFRKNNDDFFRTVEGFDEAQLGSIVPSFLGQVPLATILASRLNQQVLHTWDVRWARDKGAKLTPDAVSSVLELEPAAPVRRPPRQTGPGAEARRQDDPVPAPRARRHRRLALEPDGATLLPRAGVVARSDR